MCKDANDPKTKAELLSSVALFGKPPVLSSEDEKQFTELFHHVADCVRPQNIVEMIYLWPMLPPAPSVNTRPPAQQMQASVLDICTFAFVFSKVAALPRLPESLF